MNNLQGLKVGDRVSGTVKSFQPYGAFIELDNGIVGLAHIEDLSVARIRTPAERLQLGQKVDIIIKSINEETGRIVLSYKEIFGTWEENAADFEMGETVSGIVRSVENYGIFVELAPNLAGLAELREDIRPGQNVSVYIKAIIPEKMKLKLVIVDVCEDCEADRSFEYFTDSSHIDRWDYAPECSGREICTVF